MFELRKNKNFIGTHTGVMNLGSTNTPRWKVFQQKYVKNKQEIYSKYSNDETNTNTNNINIASIIPDVVNLSSNPYMNLNHVNYMSNAELARNDSYISRVSRLSAEKTLSNKSLNYNNISSTYHDIDEDKLNVNSFILKYNNI